MFSYYELGFRCFELNLFSHCFDSVNLSNTDVFPAVTGSKIRLRSQATILFDLKNLNLSKHFESLTGRIHCLPVIHLI